MLSQTWSNIAAIAFASISGGVFVALHISSYSSYLLRRSPRNPSAFVVPGTVSPGTGDRCRLAVQRFCHGLQIKCSNCIQLPGVKPLLSSIVTIVLIWPLKCNKTGMEKCRTQNWSTVTGFYWWQIAEEAAKCLRLHQCMTGILLPFMSITKGGLTSHSLTMMKLNLQVNARQFNYWSVAAEK